MSLTTFIDRILTENDMLQYAVEDVKEYVFEKAKEEANGESSIGIDDETVKKWILDYTPDKKADKVETKTELKTVKAKAGYTYETVRPVKEKIVSKKEKSNVEGSWGVQESLF